ncbi:hypothetical protein [Streptococcus constellatus]|uniref:hypothetical protein n=1 Tax=Streptococcus constellatus TaxID=76860 RepID=UPI0028E45997|nr:hypothetical protein [Streptococcus constellatus]
MPALFASSVVFGCSSVGFGLGVGVSGFGSSFFPSSVDGVVGSVFPPGVVDPESVDGSVEGVLGFSGTVGSEGVGAGVSGVLGFSGGHDGTVGSTGVSGVG